MLAMRIVISTADEIHISVFVVKNLFGIGVAVYQLIVCVTNAVISRQTESSLTKQQLTTAAK